MSETNRSTIELIKRLSLAIGVLGYTGGRGIHDVLVQEVAWLVDRIERDRVGRLMAHFIAGLDESFI